jgi:hypothetical protein
MLHLRVMSQVTGGSGTVCGSCLRLSESISGTGDRMHAFRTDGHLPNEYRLENLVTSEMSQSLSRPVGDSVFPW